LLPYLLSAVWCSAACTGNPAKLSISLLSIAFDIVFIMQHYVWYPSSSSSSTTSTSGTANGTAASDVQELDSSAERRSSSSSNSSSSSGSRRRPLGRRLVAVAVQAANGFRQQ
jgi:cystinosin